jgi:type VI secretion system FHA domain protein
MGLLGELLRQLVGGLMTALMARAKLKNEFRIPVTTLRPAENNPLKFSVNVREAIECLLLERGAGYQPPLSAVREGNQDLAKHQMAMMAGMQAAFESLFARFDPDVLEEVFSGESKGGAFKADNGILSNGYPWANDSTSAKPNTVINRYGPGVLESRASSLCVRRMRGGVLSY